jgi:hypothetical protein
MLKRGARPCPRAGTRRTGDKLLGERLRQLPPRALGPVRPRRRAVTLLELGV